MPVVAPISRALRVALVTLAALAPIAACYIQPVTSDSSASGGGGDGGTPGLAFCEPACTANQRCDSTVDLATCERACTSTYGAQLAHLRSDFVTAWSTCANGASCTSWQYGTALSSCHDQAASTITPSPAAQTYCTQAASKDAVCVGGGSQAVCLDSAKTFDDATLGAATNCLAQDCSQYVACTQAAFGAQ